MFDDLPENIKTELRTGWMECQLRVQSEAELMASYSVLVDEQIDTGELTRKDGKAKMKSFKKALKRAFKQDRRAA